MSHVLPEFRTALARANIDLETADWRVLLVMQDSTVPSERLGIVNLVDYTDLDEFDGAGYGRTPLINVTMTFNATTGNPELTADDIVWSLQPAGTRPIAGALLYVYVDGTAANDIAAAYYTGAGNPTGEDLTIRWDDGIFLTVE